ncbi:unnamed protein product [Sphenostylis stenocarpa]|uniref:Uncharacterized protein n=1 Tax=Sphenostylis stenocarpa TaxID=92480 RepID=A0AA86VJ22_9FABA|nr:unnamed protein product [Sphenostylis stenocarpa]
MMMMKRGDIVWVRLHVAHKWLPAFVLSSDNLGVNVTFSFPPNDAVSPSYFLHSQLLPFEDAFPSVASRHHLVDMPLLHSALRFLGQTLVSGLRCRCLTDRAQRPFNGLGSSSGFDPAGVLGFVLDAAVSPWVEVPCFARAVRVVAQVHAFRSYSSIKHKKLYQQTKIAGDKVKLISSSILGQKKHLVTQESIFLEPVEKCQIISINEESNKAIGAVKRLNLMVPVWEGNSAHLFKNKQLIISESFMDCPSLDPLYMVLESLKSSRQSLLGFKNISDLGLVDFCFVNFSTMSKTHILVPSDLMIHLRNYIDQREDNVVELCWRLPDKETIDLNRKRRRLDKSASYLQISGVEESERDAYIPKRTRPRISHIKMLEPEGSIQKDNQASTYVCETSMNFTDKVQKVYSKRSQNCESLSNSVFVFHSDKVDASAAKIEGMLGSDSSVYQESLQMICSSVATTPRSKKSTRTELLSEGCLVERKDRIQGVASCSIFNSKVEQLSGTHVPASKSLYMKFPKNFYLPSNEKLVKKFSVFGSVDSSRTRVFCYAGSAQVVFLQEADAVVAYKYAKRKALFGKAPVHFWLDPSEHKRRGFRCSPHVPPSASKPTGPPLKSCLKNSNTSTKEHRKKKRRVRFTIET